MMRMEWREKGLLQNREQGKKKECDDNNGMWGPTRSNSRYNTRRPHGHARPPSCPDDSCQQPVPLWERRFCTEVCQVPWNKLCQTKKAMSIYRDIVQWNDSAGEEAFNNAKERFWSKINGFPCSIPMPDPNMHIDIIDYDAIVDPQLIEDLYELPPTPEEDIEPCGWDSFLFTDKPVPCSGWGDSDDSDTKDFNSGLPAPSGLVNSEFSKPYSEIPNISKNAICDEINPTMVQNQQKIYSVDSTINVADNNITYPNWGKWNDELAPQDKLQFGRTSDEQWGRQFSGNNTPGERFDAKIDGHSGFRGDYSNYRGYHRPKNYFTKGRGRRVDH